MTGTPSDRRHVAATAAIERLCDERGIPIPPTLARDLAQAALGAADDRGPVIDHDEWSRDHD